MAAAAILKITKIAILTQWFGRCLRNLVLWCKMCFLTAQIFKKLNFKNPRWQTAGILKTVKSPHLCNFGPILIKFGTVMHVGPQRVT